MSFKLPENSDWFIEQNQHGPTLEYAQEIFEVVSKHPYEDALEIGCIWCVLLAGARDVMTAVTLE